MFVSNVLLAAAAIMLRLSIEFEKEKNKRSTLLFHFFCRCSVLKRCRFCHSTLYKQVREKVKISSFLSLLFFMYYLVHEIMFVHTFASISIINVIILYSSSVMSICSVYIFSMKTIFFMYLHIHLCERVRYAFSTSLSSKFQKSHQKQISCGIRAVMRLPKSLYPILTSHFFLTTRE